MIRGYQPDTTRKDGLRMWHAVELAMLVLLIGAIIMRVM